MDSPHINFNEERKPRMFSRLKTIVQLSLFAVVLTMFGNLAWAQDIDFGLHVQNLLNVYSEQLFGIKQPLDESALGDFKGLDNTLSVIVAQGLKVSNVSSAANPQHDMIALWPNDHSPTHLIVAVETSRNTDGSNASVQVIDLNGNPNSNARTILEGLTGGILSSGLRGGPSLSARKIPLAVSMRFLIL